MLRSQCVKEYLGEGMFFSKNYWLRSHSIKEDWEDTSCFKELDILSKAVELQSINTHISRPSIEKKNDIKLK